MPLKDTVPHKEAGMTQHSWLLAAVQVASWMPLPLSGQRALLSEVQSQATLGQQSLRFLLDRGDGGNQLFPSLQRARCEQQVEKTLTWLSKGLPERSLVD